MQENFEMLLEAVKNKDEDIAYHWTKSEYWATVEQIMQASGEKANALFIGRFTQVIILPLTHIKSRDAHLIVRTLPRSVKNRTCYVL